MQGMTLGSMSRPLCLCCVRDHGAVGPPLAVQLPTVIVEPLVTHRIGGWLDVVGWIGICGLRVVVLLVLVGGYCFDGCLVACVGERAVTRSRSHAVPFALFFSPHAPRTAANAV